MKFEQRLRLFFNELELIKNESVKEFTKLCLIAAPDYFFTDCPSSSTSKYHPVDEFTGNGCVIHTKRVVKVAVELSRALNCSKYNDLIVSSCIIHDLRKQGIEKSGHTVSEHPDLAARLVDEVQHSTMLLSENEYNIIRNCVGYHYGIWSSGKWKKPLQDFTRPELCVHLADYTASKRCINVKYE